MKVNQPASEYPRECGQSLEFWEHSGHNAERCTSTAPSEPSNCVSLKKV